MTQFQRTGELKSIASYPVWLQRVVRETSLRKRRVVEHELFVLMRDAKLPLAAMQRFLVGVWPTIEQFPRFMSMNLKKAGYGEGAGVDMARRYLIHNIRVEQKHADHWVEWSRSAGLDLEDLKEGSDVEGLQAPQDAEPDAAGGDGPDLHPLQVVGAGDRVGDVPAAVEDDLV